MHHYGNIPVITTDHRNTPGGPANYGISYDVFCDTVPLDEGKTVAVVTLPNAPALHIFAMRARPLVAAPPAADVYASDLPWTNTTNGWGPVERDHSLGENLWGDGNAITLHGTAGGTADQRRWRRRRQRPRRLGERAVPLRKLTCSGSLACDGGG